MRQKSRAGRFVTNSLYGSKICCSRERGALQKQILAAEQAGDDVLVSELQRKKMLVLQGKKRHGDGG